MTQKSAPIHYVIGHESMHEHIFSLKLIIESPNPQGQLLTLPAWIPGSYMIRDFAKHILSLRAEDQHGHSVSVYKTDKQNWQLSPCDGPVTIYYRVYAFDYSVRGSYLDQELAFFNGTSVFLAVDGQTDQPVTLQIKGSNQSACEHWRVATSLRATSNTGLYEYGEYQADNYQELIDHPVLIADFDLISFNVNSVDFDMVFVGAQALDKQRIEQDLSRICAHHLDLFGNDLPIQRYVFMTLVCDAGFGGLEHRASTALICGRNDLPAFASSSEMTDGYRTFLSLCSHEFFHTWLVKRIRPAEHIDPPLCAEAYTRQLWIYEGFTSFYDDMTLPRSQVIDQTSYLELLGQLLTRIHRNSGRQLQTVTESSFDAWTRFYQQDENANNAIVSYYAKGALIAICLDLLIRQQTQQRQSLNHVLQRLWHQYGLTGIGTNEDVIEKITADMGIDCQHFLQQALYSTEELPIESLLANQGLKVCYQPRNNMQDKGGKKHTSAIKYQFGANYCIDGNNLKITSVNHHSPASQAGLAKGDILIALNGWQITTDNLQSLLDQQTGTQAELLVFRRGKLLQLSLPIADAPRDSIYLEIIDQSLFDKWTSI